MIRIWLAALGAAIAVALALWSTAALAQGAWFQHEESGERRAFHRDWMAVCADGGEGQCRILRASADPGSNAFFDQRLTLFRIDNSPDWVLEFMDRDLPAADLPELTFDFGSTAIVVPGSALKAGDYAYGGAADSVTLTDPVQVQSILEAMRAGRALEVRYSPTGQGDGRATFGLRGVTAASNAVNAEVLTRQE